MKTVILAGGMGSRLSEETDVRPKPMVEIGGQPMIWHIMSLYAAAGFHEFVVALGYKGDFIKSYFLNYYQLRKDFTVDLADGAVQVYDGSHENWRVHLIDTGLETDTGGRLRRLKRVLGNETFMMTYGDGVAGLDIRELVAFHRRHGRLATVTAVRPAARFGALRLEDDRVDGFLEKSQVAEGWINGGFFVLEPGVMDYLEGDRTIWEREPLERLAADGQLVAYRHSGFWQCMDTLRDVRLLNTLWERGDAPWAVWKHGEHDA